PRAAPSRPRACCPNIDPPATPKDPFRSARTAGATPPGRRPSPPHSAGPWGAPPPPPPPRSGPQREVAPPAYDLSPVPYERRRVIDGQRSEPPARGAGRAEPLPPSDAMRSAPREPPPAVAARPAPPPALGPARGAPVTGSVTPVSVSPAATLACPMVSMLEQWLANDVQPAALRWFG